MSELSVYKQLTLGTNECLNAIRREIGMKTTCMPFAVKLITALSTLSLKTQNDELNAANVLLSGLQALMQGGIKADDYDKLDFVKRGKFIVPSARVEAFLRAAARKGYRITDTIVAVPKEDFKTTYFKENFYNGDIVYTLEDARHNPDRAVTAERLVNKYFSKFMCRLDIHEVQSGKRVAVTTCEMSIDELLTVAASSEQGLFHSYWEEYDTGKRGEKKRKVITNELNTNANAFWIKWTGEMVNKTIIRRALKRVKEVLPELTESIYAFEQEDYIPEEAKSEAVDVVIPVEYKPPQTDLYRLTAEQQAESAELLELYKANPKLAEDKFAEITGLLANGGNPQELVNREYAALTAFRHSKAKWAKIGGYFNADNETR